MGCDIHSFAEVKKDGKWQKISFKEKEDDRWDWEPFGFRSYGMFGFLADVRNYSDVPPITEVKGLPDDSEHLNTKLDEPQDFCYGYFDNGTAYTNRDQITKDLDYHHYSFLTLKELLDFDYDQEFEDLRYTKVTRTPQGGVSSNGAAVAEPGEGKMTTFRDFLPKDFFKHLEKLGTFGDPENVRVIFYFDN